MTTQNKPAEVKAPFDAAGKPVPQPLTAQDCGMEEAANLGLLREPMPTGHEPKVQKPENARPW